MSDLESQLYCRLHDLMAAEMDGTARQADREELKALLENDRDARRLYVSYIQETASLRWSLSHAAPTSSNTASTVAAADPSSFRRRRLWPVASFAAVAATLLIGAATFIIDYQREAPPAGKRDVAVQASDRSHAKLALLGETVATLTRAAHAEWADGIDPLPELTRLRVGQVLDIHSGQLEMVFDTGVEVVLDGPARFEIRSTDSAFSSRGMISARVGAEGKGFTIETPTARVIDLGTEFGVAIDEHGETDVAVFRGIVDLSLEGVAAGPDASATKRLIQGEAIRVLKSGELNRIMAIASDRFPVAAALRLGISQHAPIITDVRDNIRAGDSNKFYRIVRSGIGEDSLAFGDRNHQWNGVDQRGIPADLLGAEYVMPFNDDKFLGDLEVSLSVARPATLFIFYSDSLPRPAWLRREFVDTGLDIGLDETISPIRRNAQSAVGAGNSIDTVFSVWKRTIDKPGVVILGAVEPGDEVRTKVGYNMYGIAITPLDDLLYQDSRQGVRLPTSDHAQPNE